jgi:hypothetical protein
MSSLGADRRNETLAGDPISRACINDSSIGPTTPGIASACRNSLRPAAISASRTRCIFCRMEPAKASDGTNDLKFRAAVSASVRVRPIGERVDDFGATLIAQRGSPHQPCFYYRSQHARVSCFVQARLPWGGTSGETAGVWSTGRSRRQQASLPLFFGRVNE